MVSLKSIAFGLLAVCSTGLAAPLDARAHGSKVELLYQFLNGTWVENIAARANDQLLVTLLTTPDLYTLDPRRPGVAPTLVHRFEHATALFGITEYAPDVFAVAASNYSLSDGVTPGSGVIWTVDFSGGRDAGTAPVVSRIGAVPQAIMVNGMCTLPQRPGQLLLGDLGAGRVLRMDVATGAVVEVVPPTNGLVAAGQDPVFGTVGVDGLHVLGDYLYAANVGHRNFGKLKINPDGTPAPGAKPIILEKARSTENEDDFALDPAGDAFLVTGSGNAIIEVGPDGKRVHIAGQLNSTEIAEPTSVVLSRGKNPGKKLYVVTGGGLAYPIRGDEIVGGQVLAIDL